MTIERQDTLDETKLDLADPSGQEKKVAIAASPRHTAGPTNRPPSDAELAALKGSSSGYARSVRMKAAGALATRPPVNHNFDDEPHEELGFGD
ncbi:MAG: hypothetical protein H6799_00510 [Candidatus Nomurabacteria bacterium]|nr:MAG: hypothetical protein H6799_00510 [Candidatus Nomurabacteria bacterium]HRV76220.1 hypothetical protein [Candidatus Saccharimonadales bacterium]